MIPVDNSGTGYINRQKKNRRLSQIAITLKRLNTPAAVYDKQFELIFKAIRELMDQEQLDKNRPRIGYKMGKGK